MSMWPWKTERFQDISNKNRAPERSQPRAWHNPSCIEYLYLLKSVEMVGFGRTHFHRMALLTSIDGGVYVLQYKDTKADFNQTLPVFLQMLLTF